MMNAEEYQQIPMNVKVRMQTMILVLLGNLWTMFVMLLAVLRIQIVANQPVSNVRLEINVTVMMDVLLEIMQNKNRIVQNKNHK